jgi:hypothetical protein
MEIPRNKSVLIVVAGENYNKNVLEIAKNLQNEKTGYITFNKGFDFFVENLKKNKINSSNFLIVDCITKTLMNAKPVDNCIFVSSPNALTEISLVVNKLMKKEISNFVVDSLSNLLIYHKDEIISRFVQDLIQKERKNGKTLAFLISNKDRQSRLFSEIEILVDEIIEMK